MSVNPGEHIKQLRREKFGLSEDGTKLPNPLELDLRQALKHLAEDLYSKKHHFILELIQNAEDNAYREGDSPMLSFQLLADDPTGTPGADGCLLLLNNEQGFQPTQVQSLCSVGQSTKTKRDGYIGEKGIGFKSVFQVTNRPHVFSNGYQLYFRHPTEDGELGYIVPHWVHDEEVPGVVRGTNARTAILLPLIRDEREGIAAQLLAIAPETILFLTKLSALHIETETDKRTVIRDRRDGFVTLHSGGSEFSYFVVRAQCPRPPELQEDKRIGINERELTIAFPLDAADGFTGRIYAFLPTECESGLPFLVNADFLLTANREAILESRSWNQWLRNCIPPAFTATFKMLLRDENQRLDAYQFIPLQSDLQQMKEFLKPTVDSIHRTLRDEPCVLTDAGNFVRPSEAWFVGKTERGLLRTNEPPSGLSAFTFVGVELERWRDRLRPLGVREFIPAHFLEVINDPVWLEQRDEEWWEAVFQFLAERKVTAAAVAQIPLLLCADGVCRRPNATEVFLNGEAPVQLPTDGPEVHLFAPGLQKRLQAKPTVWAWLIQTLRLTPLSVRAYVVSRLLPWMQSQTGEGAPVKLVAATQFIFANTAALDEATKTTLKAHIPWVLANGKVANPSDRAAREVVWPEALEGADGWHWFFIGQNDREHFLVLSDEYVRGIASQEREAWRNFFGTCGATSIPDPAKREMTHGHPHYADALARCAAEVYGRPELRDWACPRWLRDFVNVEATQNGVQKLTALERWLAAFPQTYGLAKFFRLSKKDNSWEEWEELGSSSELGFALRTKPWLRTTRGYQRPSDAFLDTLELREFVGDSVPYVQSKLSADVLEKLGVRVRLSADVLVDLLRQMRTNGEVNFDLVIRIYRRLHDVQFDVNQFRTEPLVYLAEPTPARWRTANELVWRDNGPVFDQHFGYVELTYGDHDVHAFFTQKLHVPEEPDLKQFTQVWAEMSSEETPDRQTVERRLKRILDRLVSAQDELASQPWWPQIRQQLRVWTADHTFADVRVVYTPDDGYALEVFDGRVPVAWNPIQAHRFSPFIRSLGCRSLATAIQATLVAQSEASAPPSPIIMTPAAKELIVLMVCNAPNWRERLLLLEALLATEEVIFLDVIVDYSLRDNTAVAPVRKARDAFWQCGLRRLALKKGSDSEAQRSGTADSMAVALSGVMQRRELADTIYRLLMATPASARRIQQERNWTLSAEQQDWLTTMKWSRVIIDARVEEPEPIREPRTPSQVVSSQASHPAEAAKPQGEIKTAASPPSGGSPASPSQSAHPSQAVGAPSQTTSQLREQTERDSPDRQEQDATTGVSQAGRERPDRNVTGEGTDGGPRIRLKSLGAEKPQVVRAQSRQRRPRRERSANERAEQEFRTCEGEQRSGLESLSQTEKAELEARGRAYATQELREMGFDVKQMGQRSPGYDLFAKKGNEVLEVEVKAHLRTASKVFVPKGEWKEYLRTKRGTSERWELWNVEYLAADADHCVRITRYTEIPTDAIEESGFWVDLRACSSQLT